MLCVLVPLEIDSLGSDSYILSAMGSSVMLVKCSGVGKMSKEGNGELVCS